MMFDSLAFIDTTVLADALLEKNGCSGRILSAFKESEVPQYAIKEFKAGPLRYWIWTHNKLVATKSLSKTIEAIQSNFGQGNLLRSALEAIAKSNKTFEDVPWSQLASISTVP